MRSLNCKSTYISEQDYLEGEKVREMKHEYFDGEIFAIAGASRSHQRLTTNTLVAIANHLKDTPCEAFSSDMKVRADNGKNNFILMWSLVAQKVMAIVILKNPLA